MASLTALASLILFIFPAAVHGWGVDGHYTTCKIAQGRLSQTATNAVNDLLPTYAQGNLASLCSWADTVISRYPWSSALHYINTPDNLCTYEYTRDCKDANGVAGICVAGAINNYTTQLLDYGKQTSQYNLTEALLFLSHFIGDLHQPLHTGFATDRGGNTIDVHWFTKKANLHRVWDSSIMLTAEERFYDSNLENLVNAIQTNITKEWTDHVPKWEKCGRHQPTCPDKYAREGIRASCNWAYKGVANNSTLGDDYFLSRLPVVNWRLAQGGVRLAATLNRIFGSNFIFLSTVNKQFRCNKNL